MRYTSMTYEETNDRETKKAWFNVNMENEDEIFRFTDALIRVLVKICDFDEDELEDEWMNMSFDSDIGEPDFDGIQEFWNQYSERVLEELWSIDRDAFGISDFVEEEVEKKPYAGSGDDGFAAAMFPVKEGKRNVSIKNQFYKGFEVLDKELATIPSVYKALKAFKFKDDLEDFEGDYVIVIAFDKDVIDIQNVYWYLKGEKEKVKMTSNWNKEKAAAVIINGRLEYDGVYLMDSLVGTEMYITNATPTKEYLQESKILQESSSYDSEDTRPRTAKGTLIGMLTNEVESLAAKCKYDEAEFRRQYLLLCFGKYKQYYPVLYKAISNDDDEAFNIMSSILKKYDIKSPEEETLAESSKAHIQKRVKESYDSDCRTSVKAMFYNHDSDEVEDIVAEVNELHNTTFFTRELGKKIYVESETLFTSVAKLEDILEEFVQRGAAEIRFIKA